jgi:RNA polymerase sigma-70 factor, ECF subfamily
MDRSGATRARLFEELFRNHARYVHESLRRLGVRPADLPDCTQDVFLAVHGALDRYDTSRSSQAWLFGFCLRIAANHRRLARHREGSADALEAQLDAEPGPEEAASSGQRKAALLRALQALPEEQRAVVILHDLDSIAAEEISKTLGIPLGTVYSRVRLGRAKLTQLLLGLGADHE